VTLTANKFDSYDTEMTYAINEGRGRRHYRCFVNTWKALNTVFECSKVIKTLLLQLDKCESSQRNVYKLYLRLLWDRDSHENSKTDIKHCVSLVVKNVHTTFSNMSIHLVFTIIDIIIYVT
jgi:hypothetical protein